MKESIDQKKHELEGYEHEAATMDSECHGWDDERKTLGDDYD
jgi:hypothetical protein